MDSSSLTTRRRPPGARRPLRFGPQCGHVRASIKSPPRNDDHCDAVDERIITRLVSRAALASVHPGGMCTIDRELFLEEWCEWWHPCFVRLTLGACGSPSERPGGGDQKTRTSWAQTLPLAQENPAGPSVGSYLADRVFPQLNAASRAPIHASTQRGHVAFRSVNESRKGWERRRD